MTCYDVHNNGNFFLQLINLTQNKKLLTQINIGNHTKTGRQLNLNETHNIISNQNHNTTYLHDPVTDTG